MLIRDQIIKNDPKSLIEWLMAYLPSYNLSGQVWDSYQIKEFAFCEQAHMASITGSSASMSYTGSAGGF